MQTAHVQWLGKERFVAQVPSGHLVPLDSDRSSNSAAGAMELLLAALGACTATDIVSILAKKRQELDSLEVQVSGERATEPPTVWVKLEIVYKLRGNMSEEAVKHAIQLSEEKYCSVAAMLARLLRSHRVTKSNRINCALTGYLDFANVRERNDDRVADSRSRPASAKMKRLSSLEITNRAHGQYFEPV